MSPFSCHLRAHPSILQPYKARRRTWLNKCNSQISLIDEYKASSSIRTQKIEILRHYVLPSGTGVLPGTVEYRDSKVKENLSLAIRKTSEMIQYVVPDISSYPPKMCFKGSIFHPAR